MLSARTDAIVCPILGFVTRAPTSKPRDWAVSMTRMTDAQLAKKAQAVYLLKRRESREGTWKKFGW